jgi:hypothetical protein
MPSPKNKNKRKKMETSPSPMKESLTMCEETLKSLIAEAIAPLQNKIHDILLQLDEEKRKRIALEEKIVRIETHARRVNLKFLGIKER